MRIAMFSAKEYDQHSFELANEAFGLEIVFFDTRLEEKTAMLVHDCSAVCAFVNDDLSRPVLTLLAGHGVKLIAMRCAGFNNVDLEAARELGLQVVRVPAYSPEAVAEHAVGLMLCLNRRIHKAYQRTRDANFSLEGLTGFNMHGKIVGVVGTGKIGLAVLRILKGFGCQLLAYDPYPNEEARGIGASYVELDELFERSHIISLHCPLTDDSYHLLGAEAFAKMRDGVMIINTSRGGLLDSQAEINALKSGRIGSLGLDVYENERELFFEDLSNEVILDDVFRRLSSCHNVLFTGHQAFLTREALHNIAETTLANVQSFAEGRRSGNELF